MSEIQVLDKTVIDQIAAGEVVERPLSVVKELVENSIDAGATAITVEIKNGGISLIRVTDNGSGIEPQYVRTAFLPHATSKIRRVEDLLSVSSLGFRGEALSSVSAVSRVELITKSGSQLTGIRYRIEGGRELSFEEVGAPEGSTFIVRDLFYNIPARKKFLGSERTEGNAIVSLMEHLSLSHPEISFCFLSGGKAVLDTAGNRKERDVIYRIYGNRVCSSLLPVEEEAGPVRISGFIGKPDISRGSRSFENYFVNGRYIKSKVLSSGIEDAYRSFLMQHQYPFTVLHFEVDGEEIDVNIHPQKMELKFHHAEEVYDAVFSALRKTLEQKELIPEGENPREEKKTAELLPEPFERTRESVILTPADRETPQYGAKESLSASPDREIQREPGLSLQTEENGEETGGENGARTLSFSDESGKTPRIREEEPEYAVSGTAEEIEMQPEEEPRLFLTKEAREDYRILGQVFQTYWIVAFADKLYLVDQHAAHEKVIFERMMRQKERKEQTVQMLYPGIVLELTPSEEETFRSFEKELESAGYRFEPFGGRSVEITGVPSDLYGLNVRDYFLEMLDELTSSGKRAESETLYLKIATMSCKAAVKGNQTLSEAEFSALLSDLLECENPYQCPHGRPTIVTITKYELEKRFKRIVG